MLARCHVSSGVMMSRCHMSSGVTGHPVRVWSVTLILTFPSYPGLTTLATLGGLIITVITGNEDVTTLL